LSDVRQMTSSRQSPNKSTLKAGVDFDPLLEEIPPGASNVLLELPVQFHLEIFVPSSDSRSRSASHHTQKFCGGLEPPICTPLALIKPPREPHIS
jgi:hypothetical protein